jgi:uncharacterized protein YkwD
MKYLILLILTIFSNLSYSQNLVEIEKQLLILVNEERASRSLTTFITDSLINNAAKIHAKYLSTIMSFQQVSHTNPNLKYKYPSDRIKIASNSKYGTSSENVTAFTINTPKTDLEIAVQAHTNFMNSKPHKMNVLTEGIDVFDEGFISPSHYGHCVVYNERINAIIVVQMFPSLNYGYAP